MRYVSEESLEHKGTFVVSLKIDSFFFSDQRAALNDRVDRADILTNNSDRDQLHGAEEEEANHGWS